MASSNEEENPAFTVVHERHQELVDLLGDPDQAGTPEEALAAIKTKAQEMLDACNNLSLADFEEEYEESEDVETDDDLANVFR